jgi:hypothetical protein
MIIFRCENWTAVIGSIPFIVLLGLPMVQVARTGRFLYYLQVCKQYLQMRGTHVHYKRQQRAFWTLAALNSVIVGGCVVGLVWNILDRCAGN